ncbi:MAG: DUF4173 domain-containing protein [Chloroflexi bacterium]|nr:DUF4173 domain-containing protein [Chloroflexota bacterium]
MDRSVARRILVLAVGIGIAVDLLLDGSALGLNVLLVTGGGLIATLVVRPRHARLDRADLWLPVVAVLAALGPVLRTDPVVVLLDLVIVTVALGAWAVAASGRPVTRASTLAVIELGIRTVAALGIGAPTGLRGALPENAADATRARLGSSIAVLRGLLLAMPVVAVFLTLLVSADAVFAGYVEDVLALPVDLGDLVRRSLLITAVAWLAAGLLAVAAARFGVDVELLLAHQPGEEAAGPGWTPRGRAARQGATEALVVLIAVEVLFAAFVASQSAYLRRPAALDARGGVYSFYAREGYFQLVAVVCLAGLLLTAVEWFAGASRWFVIAALGFIAVTFVILASAAVRLGLYLQAYGWTELRFYVAASIAWLATGGFILAVLVARRRMAWLWHGLAISAVAITLAISAIGPQAFTAQQNLARALDPALVPPDGETGLDAWYLGAFSDDAIPAIVAALPRLDSESRATLELALMKRQSHLASDRSTVLWPAWNLARERAREALETLPLR